MMMQFLQPADTSLRELLFQENKLACIAQTSTDLEALEVYRSLLAYFRWVCAIPHQPLQGL
jgi:hypothetical protein